MFEVMATQHKEISFDAFLSSTPTIKELTEHINVSNKWYLVGTMLELDQKRLKSIEAHVGHTDAHKTVKMFDLWLETTPTASRRQVLEAMRVDAVEEITLAHKYEMHLRELHQTIYVPPSTEEVLILQRNIQSLSKALVSPVQVSQLLYCKRCISEATLDQIERIDQRRSLDDKKTTLLTAMQETVSNDYRKLKDIATVLSDVEGTKDIAQEIMTKYEEKILQEDDSTVVQPQEAVGGNENRASDILRNNYSSLSQSIIEPVRMARLLHEEAISDEALSCIISTRDSVSVSRAVLLKAVRDAVHFNYKHLESFVTVLRKFSETAHIGDTIFEEYRKHFNYDDDDVPENEIFLTERNRDSQQKPMSTSSESSSLDDYEVDKHGNHKILFPRNMKKEFEKMRSKLGSTFFRVRRIFKSKKNVLDINEVKELISDCFSDLKPQLSDNTTIGEVLDVLKRKCNIMNISPLEDLASEFNIKDAIPIIESFKEEAKDFSNSVSVSLCLGEELQAVATPSHLLCETVVFVFNWNPDECTLQDINDGLFELEPLNRFKYCLQVDKVGPGQSVVVTCYCPAEYTGSLIMTVLGNIEILQRKGLKEFILGNCTVWHATQALSENAEGADLLAQINDLKAALRDEDTMLMKLATVKEELLGNIKNELEALRKDFRESQCIIVQKEEVINELKEEISSLKEKLFKKKKETKNNNKDGDVAWSQFGVQLTKPSVDQFMEVISKLEEKHKIMTFSKCEDIKLLIPTILGRITIKGLFIQSSFLSRADILSFSSQLSTNKSLTILALSTSSIDDSGVIALAQSLQDNQTLKNLVLSKNPGITSTCAQSLANLLLNNNTLNCLYLHNTNIGNDGVMILMESLKTKNTLDELGLDKRHEKTCATVTYYEQIRDILKLETY
ncbi:PREDICTED: uncharacterized protein LOC109582257 [Amphimedon queenslandica]|uniref:Death domain-containing protein n=2 Tax=Amphimedon queenslandica TaxID=400682 RepID=A0AAN0J6Z2_AMPQE|nr:PREDICTED: uncharacterized protein LOC109582257 [Amphimedon queenslandica]|eukprot:XP_019852468.1 PREDICTED: uncharacterized protein LOC109582257 [Amphimedon queenslandica]